WWSGRGTVVISVAGRVAVSVWLLIMITGRVWCAGCCVCLVTIICWGRWRMTIRIGWLSWLVGRWSICGTLRRRRAWVRGRVLDDSGVHLVEDDGLPVLELSGVFPCG